MRRTRVQQRAVARDAVRIEDYLPGDYYQACKVLGYCSLQKTYGNELLLP